MHLGLLVSAICGCADVPWRAEQITLPSSSRFSADEAPGAGQPVTLPTIDRDHEYALVELVDLAERNNPETRETWQQARAAAARLGSAEAVFLPSLTIVATGGFQRTPYPSPNGPFAVSGPFTDAELQLAWTLLDLSRFARVSATRALVRSAAFTFSRKHQEVLFAVARAYYALTASQAQLRAARVTLNQATTVEEAAQARLGVGLATRPEVLLAREGRTRAAFDVEAAQGAVHAAEGALAESLGIAPDPPLKVVPYTESGEPERLARSVEDVMRAALAARPDLKALQAQVVAQKAEERAARGRFGPRLGLDVSGGYQWWWYDAIPGQSSTLAAPTVDAHLSLDWNLFAGFADVEHLHEVEAERMASEDALAAGSLRALREAWTAYFDVKTAERKVEFGDSLVAASEEAYKATLETYRRGLGSLIELLTAERDLAAARETAIRSHAELLTAAAALTLAMGAGLVAERPTIPLRFP